MYNSLREFDREHAGFDFHLRTLGSPYVRVLQNDNMFTDHWFLLWIEMPVDLNIPYWTEPDEFTVHVFDEYTEQDYTLVFDDLNAAIRELNSLNRFSVPGGLLSRGYYAEQDY